MSRRRPAPFSLFSFQDIITGLCGILIFLVLMMVVDLVSRRDAAPPPPPIEQALPQETPEALHAAITRLREELAELQARARLVIVAEQEAVAPEQVERLNAEQAERARELAALRSQLEALRQRLARDEAADAQNRQRLREMEETRRLLEAKLQAMNERSGITLIPERGESKIPLYVLLSRNGAELLQPLAKTNRRRAFPQPGALSGLLDALSAFDHTTHTVILLVRPSGLPLMHEAARRVSQAGFTYGRDPLEEEIEVDLAPLP